MGSVWCKPSEMRQDCSPKLNLHSLLSRFSSQMCPSKCRYSHPNRARHKPRPRSVVLAEGKRPVISSPLVQPVPPPRKKRKHIQDFSHSEEVLYEKEIINPSLRTAISLPVICEPTTITITSEPFDTISRMESIEEEPTNETLGNCKLEFEDIPNDGEVYFMKKETIPVVFKGETKNIIEIRKELEEMPDNNDYLPKNKKPIVTFNENAEIIEDCVDYNNPFDGDDDEDDDDVENVKNSPNTSNIIEKSSEKTEIKTVDTLETVPKTETIQKPNSNDVEKDPTEELEMHSSLDISDNKLNFITDQKDIESIKRWQDAMKTRWLQSILVESEPSESDKTVKFSDNKTANSVTNNEGLLDTTKKDSRTIINRSESFNDTKDDLKNLKNKCINEAISTTEDASKDTIVTKTEKLEQLQSPQILLSMRENNNQPDKPDSLLKHVNENETLSKKENTSKLDKKESLKLDTGSDKDELKTEPPSRHSRHSSITDSLQEFESSIYDMLQQSAKDSISDEDDSFVIINTKHITNNINNSTKIDTEKSY